MQDGKIKNYKSKLCLVAHFIKILVKNTIVRFVTNLCVTNYGYTPKLY